MVGAEWRASHIAHRNLPVVRRAGGARRNPPFLPGHHGGVALRSPYSLPTWSVRKRVAIVMSFNPRLQSCDVNKFASVGSLTQKSDAELVAGVEMDDDSVLVDIDALEALDALRQRRKPAGEGVSPGSRRQPRAPLTKP
jgi:hypothetical protein